MLAFSLISHVIHPGTVQDFAPVRNPFGIESVPAILAVIDATGGWGGLACVVAVVLSLIVRFHRSRGEERLQIK